MDEITHLHIQQKRLVGILHVEGIEVPVFGYYRHIGLLPEIACRGLYTDYILGTVGLAGYQVCRTEIHILDRSRENDMNSLVIRYFQSVRRNHLAETDLAGQPLIIITAADTPSKRANIIRIFFMCFCLMVVFSFIVSCISFLR